MMEGYFVLFLVWRGEIYIKKMKRKGDPLHFCIVTENNNGFTMNQVIVFAIL